MAITLCLIILLSVLLFFIITPYTPRWLKIMISIIFGVVLAAAVLFVTSIPNTPQVFGTSVRCVKTNEKIVALTYDDGPRSPTTEGVLDVLEKQQVPATFFLIGERVEKNKDLVKKIYQAGHELGNHTYSHSLLVFRSPSFVRKQIEKTDAIIRDCGYTKDIHFRSPHGMKLFCDAWVLKKMKRKNILFDCVAWDWTSPGVEKIVSNVMKDVKPGSIILLHDGCGDEKDVIKASEIIIEKLKAQGYRFVTISELLQSEAKNTVCTA